MKELSRTIVGNRKRSAVYFGTLNYNIMEAIKKSKYAKDLKSMMNQWTLEFNKETESLRDNQLYRIMSNVDVSTLLLEDIEKMKELVTEEIEFVPFHRNMRKGKNDFFGIFTN